MSEHEVAFEDVVEKIEEMKEEIEELFSSIQLLGKLIEAAEILNSFDETETAMKVLEAVEKQLPTENRKEKLRKALLECGILPQTRRLERE